MKATKISALVALMMVPLLAFRFGGWAVITVDSLPSHLTAGAPTTLGFIVRQHGRLPLTDLHPKVFLTSGNTELTVYATPGRQAGEYVSTITPSAPGDWTIRIVSGFMNAENTLLPLRAVPAGAPAPRTLADAEIGHQLYVAKGCVTCHVRDGVGGKAGPELTGRRYAQEAVATFLADPESSPLSRNWPPNGVRMPQLNLSPSEISRLVAYVNSESMVGSSMRR